MKRSLGLILLLFVASVSFAQVSWNVKAGVNLSNWSKGDMDSKFGFKVGAGMEYAFDEVWAIQPSLLLSTKGAKGDIVDEDGDKMEMNVNQMYLELPIMAAARLAVSDNMNFVITAGPYLAYGIGGKVKYTFEGESVKYDTFGDGDFDGNLKKFDAGLGVGVAAEFGKIVVGLEGQFGLTKLGDGSGTPKNQNFSLVLGYKF